jgi:hypothetical protein
MRMGRTRNRRAKSPRVSPLRGALLIVAMLVAAMVTTAGIAAAAPTRLARAAKTRSVADEFQNPSWTGLPPRTVYNRLPSCKLDGANGYTCLPGISKSSPAADPGNPEAYANSAYWPAEQRPDIEHYGMNRYGYDYDNCAENTVHYCFYVVAQKLGYPISHKPKVGDLAVFAGDCALPGPDTAVPSDCVTQSDHYWYVEYVQKVLKNGAYIGSGGGASGYSDSLNDIDSGIIEQEISGNSDPYTYFIGLMPKKRARPAPKHRRAEPATLVRFSADPTTADPALTVHFWLSRSAPSVRVKLEEQYGPTTPITLKNVSAGRHQVSLPLSSGDVAEFSSHPYVNVSYALTVGSAHYEAPLVTIASSTQSANRGRLAPLNRR